MRKIVNIIVLLPLFMCVNPVFSEDEQKILLSRENLEYQLSMGECYLQQENERTTDVVAEGNFKNKVEFFDTPHTLNCMGVISFTFDHPPCAQLDQGFACARYSTSLNLLVKLTLSLSVQEEERTYIGDTAYSQGKITLTMRECEVLPDFDNKKPIISMSQCGSSLRLVDETRHCFFRRDANYCVTLDDTYRTFKETWFFTKR